MPRVGSILRTARKALEDLDLLKVLQSEIKYELSSERFQNHQSGSPGEFIVDWDSPETKDIVLRGNCSSGEKFAISAMLGPLNFERDTMYPRDVLMKVCVSKSGLSSSLQFDCRVSQKDNSGSDFDVCNAYFLQSPTSMGSSVYKGPLFSTLDPNLQDALKEYLIARGIGEGLTNFLLLHLHKREQGQYVNWLQNLESFLGRSD